MILHAHASAFGGASALFGACLVPCVLYGFAILRTGHRYRPWKPWRTASFLSGVGLIGLSLAPPFASLAHGDIRVHMIAHLMLGMFGPIGVVLGAPVTLALRNMSPARARLLVRILRSRPVHVLSHPVTALVVNMGGMAALYATPLFAMMSRHPALHVAVHVHFLLAGCLFSWSIAGADPGAARRSHALRLAVLFVAIAAHAILAKAMYAAGLPRGTAYSTQDLQQAAKIMYYGGDLSELLLAIALFASWRNAWRD